MFLTPDGTFFIQLIDFGIFLAILNVVFLRPVGAAIKKRREYIDGVKGDLERYEHEITALRGEAAQQRGAARRAAEETILKARAEADAKAAALAAEYAARAQAITAESQATVATEVNAARTGIDRRSAELAGVLLERALESPVVAGRPGA